ncbi:MAG: sugar phosphate isomerase/epimerase [Euryarchaeota archaeon]|nr:sugar phosphate isomerase/epimerase [Euryarchaeota archaeon]
MIRIAVSSPAFSHVPVERAAPDILAHFGAWEIVAEHRHHLSRIRGYLHELAQDRDVELRVHAPLSDINIASFSDRVRQASMAEVLETVRISGELGVACVTVHPGLVSPTSSMDIGRVRALVREAARELSGASVEHGVPVAFENMPRMKWLAFREPAELLEVVEGTELGICFDAGHANTCGNTENWLELRDRFINVHLHDNRGERDEHLGLGEGTVPLGRILGALKGSYKGTYVIESNDLSQGVRSRDILKDWLMKLHGG